MFRKPIVHFALSALLYSFVMPTVLAQSKEEKATIEDVKKRIVKLGTGSETKVQAKGWA